MTDFDIEASRARMAEFDADRTRRRPPRRAPRQRRTMDTPMGARNSAAGARIAEIHARADDDPRGSIARPLPMGPFESPATTRARRHRASERRRTA